MKFVLSIVAIFLCATQPLYAGCEVKIPPTEGLVTKKGFMEFMKPEELRPLLKMLPIVANSEIDSLLHSPDTMWYDEASMVYLYQDSIETVVGARANCVGRLVGERNKNDPAISKLLNLFGPDYRFLFPFRTAAGTDDNENVRVVNFWAPPRKGGEVLPVKYWQPTARARWRWTFPLGTIFGELLYQKSPEGRWYPFEIRTRRRYRDGWSVNLFRPFLTAESFAQAIIDWRPKWQSSPNLSSVVAFLRNKNTLVAHTVTSPAFSKVFPDVTGALDPLPAVEDSDLIGSLLHQTPFQSAEGAIWKENGKLETYAPASTGGFSIVPQGYQMGMYPVNEVSCARCHSETGRNLGQFIFDVILYGEIWGEDKIFTWHLFEVNPRIFDTWDDNDGSRKVNPRMIQSGLVVKEKPAAGDSDYNILPSAYVPEKPEGFAQKLLKM